MKSRHIRERFIEAWGTGIQEAPRGGGGVGLGPSTASCARLLPHPTRWPPVSTPEYRVLDETEAARESRSTRSTAPLEDFLAPEQRPGSAWTLVGLVHAGPRGAHGPHRLLAAGAAQGEAAEAAAAGDRRARRG